MIWVKTQRWGEGSKGKSHRAGKSRSGGNLLYWSSNFTNKQLPFFQFMSITIMREYNHITKLSFAKQTHIKKVRDTDSDSNPFICNVWHLNFFFKKLANIKLVSGWTGFSPQVISVQLYLVSWDSFQTSKRAVLSIILLKQETLTDPMWDICIPDPVCTCQKGKCHIIQTTHCSTLWHQITLALG